MYKDVSEQKQENIIDAELEHFVGQYLNVNLLDDQAKHIYGEVLHTVGRAIEELCANNHHGKLKPEDLSNIFQHLTSFKMTYEKMMEHTVKMLKIVKENVEG